MSYELQLKVHKWTLKNDESNLFEYKIFNNLEFFTSIYNKKKPYYDKQIIGTSNAKESLFEIENNLKDRYYIKTKEYNFDNKIGWIVLRNYFDNKAKGVKLKEGDIIKLGRIVFIIKETKYKSNKKHIADLFDKETKEYNAKKQSNLLNSNLNLVSNFVSTNLIQATSIIDKENLYESNQNIMVNYQGIKLTNNSKKQCRICLRSNNTQSNPILNLCKCQGTMGDLHLECLKHWFKNKLTTRIYAYLIVHFYKDLKCEICQSPIPESINLKKDGKEKLVYLLELNLPTDEEYIILETLSNDKKENKFLYVIHMTANTKLLMGRSTECDIKMTDISISRVHAHLENINGEIYFTDNSSKFGTLMKLQTELLILPEKELGIQFNDYLVLFSMKRKFISYICCKNLDLGFDSYNEFLEYKKIKKIKEIPEFEINGLNESYSSSNSFHNLDEQDSGVITRRPEYKVNDVNEISINNTNENKLNYTNQFDSSIKEKKESKISEEDEIVYIDYKKKFFNNEINNLNQNIEISKKISIRKSINSLGSNCLYNSKMSCNSKNNIFIGSKSSKNNLLLLDNNIDNNSIKLDTDNLRINTIINLRENVDTNNNTINNKISVKNYNVQASGSNIKFFNNFEEYRKPQLHLLDSKSLFSKIDHPPFIRESFKKIRSNSHDKRKNSGERSLDDLMDYKK